MQNPTCIFCNIETSDYLYEDDLVFVVDDRNAVTPGHKLLIPKRHVADYFDLTQEEISAINDAAQRQRKQLLESDPTITGFNFGTNCGEAAGQTIFHAHVHLIPRRDGDVENPRGGVRGVIPGKQGY